MVHDPETLTIQTMLRMLYYGYESFDHGQEPMSEETWVEVFRLARIRAKTDHLDILEAIKAEIVLRLS